LISWNRKPRDVAKYPFLKTDADYQDWKLKMKPSDSAQIRSGNLNIDSFTSIDGQSTEDDTTTIDGEFILLF
jgi:hypothetical protein